MKAAWYEKQGPAREVLMVGEMPDPTASAGEVRIRIAASGINPGDIKKRQDSFGLGMAHPRFIPHSDGAGRVDQVGEGVSTDWIGQSVWCYGAQSYRPFGTGRRVQCGACRKSRSFVQERVNGAGCMSWHSGDHSPSRRARGRGYEWTYGIGAGGGRLGGPVRGSIGATS